MPLFSEDSPWFNFGRSLANLARERMPEPPLSPPQYSSTATQQPWTPPPPPNFFTQDRPDAYGPVQSESFAQPRSLPLPPPPALPTAPTGRTFDQITGTDYLSEDEMLWWKRMRDGVAQPPLPPAPPAPPVPPPLDLGIGASGGHGALVAPPPVEMPYPLTDAQQMQAAGEADYLATTPPISFQPEFGPGPYAWQLAEPPTRENLASYYGNASNTARLMAGNAGYPTTSKLLDEQKPLSDVIRDIPIPIVPNMPTAPGGYTPPAKQPTIGDVYDVAQAPSRFAGEQIRQNVPGLPGEVLGRGAEFALAPENIAGAAIAGPAVASNLLGRGSMSALPYFTSLFGAGAGAELGKESGLPGGEIAGGLLGGVSGAFAPAIGRAAAGAAGDVARNLPSDGYFAGVGGGGKLQREVAEQAARDASDVVAPPSAGGAPKPSEVVPPLSAAPIPSQVPVQAAPPPGAQQEAERAIFGPSVDDLPSVGGGSRAATVLDAEQTAALSHFTNMTRGVIGNHSTMQRLYASVRPLTAPVTGDVQNSKIAELIARESELRTLISRVGATLTPDEIETVTQTWREGMLKRYFRGPEYTAAKATLDDRVKTLTGQTDTAFDNVQEALRSSTLALDISVLGQQLEAAVRRGGVPIITGVVRDTANRIASKLHLPGVPEVYLRNDLDHVSQAIADGLIMSGGQSADIAKKTAWGHIPKIGKPFENFLNGLADVQYDKLLGTARLRAYEGLLTQNRIIHSLTGGKLGGDIADPLVRRHIAEFANMVGSTSRTATGAVRSQVERKGLLTARMTRAQVNEVLTPLKSFRSQEDVLNTMNLVGSIALTLGAGKAINDEFGIGDFVMDPFRYGFGDITLSAKDSNGKNQVINIFPQATFAKTLFQSLSALNDGDTKRLQEAWIRLGYGRLNLLPQNVARFGGYGYDKDSRFHYGDLTKGEFAAQSVPIPLGVRETAESGRTDPLSIALTMTGQSSRAESYYGEGDRLARAMFNGRGLDELTDEERAQVQASQTQQPEAGPVSQARLDIEKGFTEKQQTFEAAFQRGENTQEIGPFLSALNRDRAVAATQRDIDFAKTISGFKQDEFDKIKNGYYALAINNTDGTINWERTEKAREQYIQSLSTSPRDKGGPSDREVMESYLRYNDSRKSDIAKRLDTYYDQKEAAGYYAPDADSTKLDKAHPKLDFEGWVLGHSVDADTGERNDRVLQSVEAVNMALQSGMPNRDIKYQGLKRPINQDEGSVAAWERSRGPITQFENAIASLEPNRRSAGSVAVRKDNPELDAWLWWWGRTETLQSRAAASALQRIMQQYGKTLAPGQAQPKLAENAR